MITRGDKGKVYGNLNLQLFKNPGNPENNKIIEEIHTCGGAALGKETGYTFFMTTDLSYKLDEIFGFNKYDSICQKYFHRVSEEEKQTILDIDTVAHCPIKGLTGEIEIPVLKEVDDNIGSAIASIIGSHESIKVTHYFSELAKKVGFFFALPYEEIIKSIKNDISAKDIERAVEEGYVRLGYTDHYDGNKIVMAELTDKFCPFEKCENI